MRAMNAIRAFWVSGSPKFDLSNADFGWGTARKLEILTIDEEKYSMSLCKSRDSDGGLEIGLSLPKARMEAFATIFDEGLRF
ncbi:UNVERIFIED_CONTAM: Malonyl-coenzyme:anthocyanin 5-O-glucoside-6'''-O-malonyltransferase [Sesamum angustifolium]